jgi:cell pole-organizing protein PopZ
MSAANVPVATPSLDAERRAYEPSMEEILASIRKIIADDDSLPAMRDPNRRSMDEDFKPANSSPAAQDKAAPPQDPDESFGAREPSQVFAARLDRWPRPVYRPEIRGSAEQDESRTTGFGNLRGRSSADEPLAPAQGFRTERRPLGPAGKLQDQPAHSCSEEDEVELDDDAFEDAVEDSAVFAAGPASGGDERPESEPARQPLVSPDAAASVAAHFQALAASMVMNDSEFLHRCAQEMLRPMLKQWLDDNLPVLVERLVRAEIERVARGRR